MTSNVGPSGMICVPQLHEFHLKSIQILLLNALSRYKVEFGPAFQCKKSIQFNIVITVIRYNIVFSKSSEKKFGR